VSENDLHIGPASFDSRFAAAQDEEGFFGIGSDAALPSSSP